MSARPYYAYVLVILPTETIWAVRPQGVGLAERNYFDLIWHRVGGPAASNPMRTRWWLWDKPHHRDPCQYAVEDWLETQEGEK